MGLGIVYTSKSPITVSSEQADAMLKEHSEIRLSLGNDSMFLLILSVLLLVQILLLVPLMLSETDASHILSSGNLCVMSDSASSSPLASRPRAIANLRKPFQY